MTTYAIGDIQGCFKSFEALLKTINFDEGKDTLWFVGDLVNRGPDSLGVLRFVTALGDRAVMVLGNHDLHLLAIYHQQASHQPNDTLQDILDAPDCDALCGWLGQQKLLHYDEGLGYVMVHAGIPPVWSLEEAIGYAGEVESILRSDRAPDYFAQMYGDEPDHWEDSLEGFDRYRLITNYLTRMRFCDADGGLHLDVKSAPGTEPEGMMPWFKVPGRKVITPRIIFGHWAALNGKTGDERLIHVDTGCIWGGVLTAVRLGDHVRFETKGSSIK